jgi:predicted transcriptional regulator
MEKAGVVTSALESSPNGPERRRYSLAKSISITMDMAPHLFKEKATSFSRPPPGTKSPRERKTPFGERIGEALAAGDDRAKLSLISQILNDIDIGIVAVDQERVDLLSARNELMNEAAKIVANMEGLDTRRVAFHILEEHDREVESISQSLDMREMVVRSILEELERDFFG